MKLLAKPIDPKKPSEVITIASHTFDVYNAAIELFNIGFFDSMIEQFKLDSERFLLHLKICALLHDIGKANEDFQGMINGSRTERQRIRHEHLSAWMIFQLRDWFNQSPMIKSFSRTNVMCAVLGHHLKSSVQGKTKDNNYIFGNLDHVNSTLRIYTNSKVENGKNDVKLILCEVQKILHIPHKCPKLPKTAELTRKDFSKVIDFMDSSSISQSTKLFIGALKIALILADSIGSHLKDKTKIEAFVKNIKINPITPEDIYNDVLAHKVTGAFKFNQMQENICEYNADQNPARVLLINSCGSGKTIAAYRWMQYIAGLHKIYHTIFCYPTKATTTEGFLDYLYQTDKGVILHSAAKLELERKLHEVRAQLEEGKDAIGSQLQGIPNGMSPETYIKYLENREVYLEYLHDADTLGLFGSRYFATTVDQFSFFEFGRNAILRAPMLFRSAIVFDEIHSYDGVMLDNLFSLIDNVDNRVPILVMSATIPENLKREFLDRGFCIKPDDRLDDVEIEANYKRYDIELTSSAKAKKIALEKYQNGKKVLFICNRVAESTDQDEADACQDVAKQFKAAGAKVLCYHSRFREKDRVKKQREVINAFNGSEPIIAVTTQVCEMSLNIDADVLVSAIAPPSSLIQRMGRACRNRHKGNIPNRKARIVMFLSHTEKPYDIEEIQRGFDFIKNLLGKDISQEMLSSALMELSKGDEPTTEAHTAPFFSNFPWLTYANATREEDEYLWPCILDKDLDVARKAYKINRQSIQEYIVKVPCYRAMPLEDSILPKYIRTQHSSSYSEEFGFY